MLPIAAALLLPVFSGAAGARVLSLVVPVRGMTCALCTRGVEESVKSLGGMSAAADLATARVRVEAGDGRSLVIRDVKERVLSAGFGIGGECEVTAAGRFQIGPDRQLTFRVHQSPYVFQVLEGNQLRRMFRLFPGLKGEFRLTFRLHEHPNWKPPGIAITAFEAVAAPPPPPRAGR